MALFQSYAVIYLAIHEVLFVFYSYPNDNTETATFDRTVLIVMAMLTTVAGGLRLGCPSEPVSVYDWLKNGFVTHEVNAEAAHTPYL